MDPGMRLQPLKMRVVCRRRVIVWTRLEVLYQSEAVISLGSRESIRVGLFLHRPAEELSVPICSDGIVTHLAFEENESVLL
jgi:hypothetical protein